ncbi:MAG TPA: DNA-directed RNA polymerase subunit omega [Firmicutes bacterium]|nr:DNA-directed RNA polymerase subunit omega [Bacillota bacterium]
MMLEPTMSDLLKVIPNRYLLVNIAAKRARDIAEAAEAAEEPLNEKPVKLALYDIMEHRIRPVLEEAEEVEAEGAEAAQEPEEEPEQEQQ